MTDIPAEFHVDPIEQLRYELGFVEPATEGHGLAIRAMEHMDQLADENAKLRALIADEHSRLSQEFDNAEEVVRLRTEVAELRAKLSQAAEVPTGDAFVPGRVYRSENGYFEFRCERYVGEVAIGIETVLKPWQVYPGTKLQKWATVGPSVGYVDVTDEVSADDPQ